MVCCLSFKDCCYIQSKSCHRPLGRLEGIYLAFCLTKRFGLYLLYWLLWLRFYGRCQLIMNSAEWLKMIQMRKTSSIRTFWITLRLHIVWIDRFYGRGTILTVILTENKHKCGILVNYQFRVWTHYVGTSSQAYYAFICTQPVDNISYRKFTGTQQTANL